MSQASSVKPKVLILGAGIGGLSAAWVLSQRGFEVKILEKEKINGGLAVTLQKDGYRYDLGPHNIHTQLPQIVTFLKRHFPSLYRHDPKVQIFKRKRFIPYPITGAKVLTSLPFWKLPIAGLDFFLARLRMYFSDPKKDDTFRDWISNRFGRIVYREYFHDYPIKVWRLPTEQIDPYVAEKRIPVTGLVDMIKAVLRKPAPIRHAEFSAENLYLRTGIGEMVEFFERQALDRGARVENQVRLARIQSRGDSVTAVEYFDSSGQQCTESCDYLLSTIPLNEFIGLFDVVESEARESAAALDYCSSVLLFLKIGRRNALPAAMLYFSEPSILFSRVSDTFSTAMCPDGKTLLCFEFPCTPGDGVWTMTTEQLREHAEAVLTEKGVLRSDDVEGAFVEKVRHSYPRFKIGFQERVNRVFQFLGSKKNVISYGRQGGFAYINTDNVVSLGFKAAAAVAMAEPSGYTCQEWFTAKN